MSGALLALVAGSIGAILWWRNRLPRVVTILALLVGFGVSGWAGDWLRRAGVWGGQYLAQWTTKTVGAGLPGLLALLLLMIVVIDLHPRWGVSQNRYLPLVAFVLALTLPMLGGAVGTSANTAVAWLGNSAAHLGTALFGG